MGGMGRLLRVMVGQFLGLRVCSGLILIRLFLFPNLYTRFGEDLSGLECGWRLFQGLS